jgi:hypothetical protein
VNNRTARQFANQQASRDPRVTRGFFSHIRGLRRRAIGRGTTASFVREIMGRHGRSCAAIVPVDRASRQLRVPPGIAYHTHHHEYWLALRLGVRLTRQVRGRALARPFLAWRSAAATAPRPTVQAMQISLLDRIFARERRIESTTTVREMFERIIAGRGITRDRAGAPSPAQRPAPAIEMVVRRQIAMQPAETPLWRSGVRPESDDGHAVPTRLRKAESTPPIPLTSAELGRLTDQVVNTIDRRFVAYRERRGGL